MGFLQRAVPRSRPNFGVLSTIRNSPQVQHGECHGPTSWTAVKPRLEITWSNPLTFSCTSPWTTDPCLQIRDLLSSVSGGIGSARPCWYQPDTTLIFLLNPRFILIFAKCLIGTRTIFRTTGGAPRLDCKGVHDHDMLHEVSTSLLTTSLTCHGIKCGRRYRSLGPLFF